jgi:hypothetical protein
VTEPTIALVVSPWAGAGTRSAKSKAAMRTRFRRIDLGMPK